MRFIKEITPEKYLGDKEVYDESEEETLEKMAREKYAGRNDSSGSNSDVSSEDETNTNKYYV